MLTIGGIVEKQINELIDALLETSAYLPDEVGYSHTGYGIMFLPGDAKELKEKILNVLTRLGRNESFWEEVPPNNSL